MDYYESAEDITISKERAKQEIRKHSVSWEEFVEECGEHDSSAMVNVQHKIEKECIEQLEAACADCCGVAQAFHNSKFYKEFEASEAEGF